MTQNRSNSSQNHFPQDEPEISLLDILRFLKGAWKIIAVTGALGLMVSSLYLRVIPDQYEATTRIIMAKIPNPNNDVIGISMEEPATLISRFKVSLIDDLDTSCGFGSAAEIQSNLNQYIHLSVAKQYDSTLEIKVTSPTQDLAKSCARSISDLIVADQKKMLDALLESTEDQKKSRLIIIEQRLRQNRALFSKLDQTGASLSQVFLDLLLETRRLEDESDQILNNSIRFKRLKVDTLQSSITVSENLVVSKAPRIVSIGLFGGIFLGLLFALIRRDIKKHKSVADGFL